MHRACFAASIALVSWAFDASAERVTDGESDFAIDFPVDDACVLVPKGRASGPTCEGFDATALSKALGKISDQESIFAFRKPVGGSFVVVTLTRSEPMAELQPTDVAKFDKGFTEGMDKHAHLRAPLSTSLARVNGTQVITTAASATFPTPGGGFDETIQAYVLVGQDATYTINVVGEDATAADADAMVRKALTTLSLPPGAKTKVEARGAAFGRLAGTIMAVLAVPSFVLIVIALVFAIQTRKRPQPR